MPGIGSGAQPTSYPMGNGAIKRPDRAADHAPHLLPRLRMCGAISPLSRTFSWRDAWLDTETTLRECIQKFADWPPGARTANGKVLCH
jgi:hypothetical protein